MNLKNTIVNKITTLKDGSVKIELVTRELPPQELAELFYSVNKEVVSVDIPDEIEGNKSPAKRFRDRLFVYYNSTYGKKEGFSVWYGETLDTIGEKYLDKIN